jgi:hypothetical protein
LIDFQRVRVAYYVSGIIFKELSKKYDATTTNYQDKIKNRTDENIYKITMDIQKRYNLRGFYICKGDKAKAIESFRKVQEIRKKRPKPQEAYLEEWIKSYHEILKECRYETGAIDALLEIYRKNKNREKYNELMLRIIKEDQVDYDYLYYPINRINSSFIIQYLYFFTQINPLREKLILTREQVNFIAEDMLTKHKELLNFKNKYYIRDNTVDEYHMRDAINALISVSTWLKEYKLNELNDKLLEQYFSDEVVINTIRYDPQFKEFMDYLQKWRDEKEKGEKEKKKLIEESKTKK